MTSRKKAKGNGAHKRAVPSVRETAQRHSLKAVEKLVKLVDSVNERVALSAAQTVLDRALGKVTQAMSLRGTDGGLVVKIVRFNQERADE
ncbi:MAG TPA: hypothetical protein VLG68_00360 [Gammaproteobacteria bacterium]|nr:hypothetical protein [Gammaproteobacteria bacterium]